MSRYTCRQHKVLATSLSKSIDQRYDISRLITKKELLCLRLLNTRRPNPFDFSKDMVAKPARDQKTPSQSHSSGSYWETDMGKAERFYRDGWKPFDYIKVPVIERNPARVYEN